VPQEENATADTVWPAGQARDKSAGQPPHSRLKPQMEEGIVYLPAGQIEAPRRSDRANKAASTKKPGECPIANVSAGRYHTLETVPFVALTELPRNTSAQ
jgi:hypothetical protein